MAVLSGAKLDIISLISKFSDDFFAFYRKKPYLRNMKHVYGIVWLLAFCLLIGCQKSIDEGSDNNGGATNGSAGTTGITGEEKANALTIAQAQRVANGTSICVKGFIVAATERSINNAIFTEPFEGSSAIVLASRQSNGTSNQFEDAGLFPICLTDAAKNIRNFYNLKDNPTYWNQYVYITGTKDEYLSLPGLKKVKAIETDPNHVVTPDEEPDDDGGTTESDNPDVDPEDDGPGDDSNGSDPTYPDESGNDDGGNESTNNVLTVAQAKKLSSPTHNITVQGYIVAATAYDMPSCTFQAPFNEDYNTCIVLADKPFDNNIPPEQQYDLAESKEDPEAPLYTDLLPIHLGAKNKNTWIDLNLFKNPYLHNKILQIKGTIIRQFKTIGIYQVEDYTITP